jgi:type IV pilus assembly protein PilA
MLARIRKSMEEKDQGFTLIELLVVIIIIGILAAIAIPTFLNQREKGWEAQVESDLKNATTAAESFAVDNNGGYTNGATAMTFADLEAQGYNASPEVNLTVDSATATGFVLEAGHDRLGTARWHYSSTTGEIAEGAAP